MAREGTARRAQKKVHLDQLEKRKAGRQGEIYVGIGKSAANVIDHLRSLFSHFVRKEQGITRLPFLLSGLVGMPPLYGPHPPFLGVRDDALG